VGVGAADAEVAVGWRGATRYRSKHLCLKLPCKPSTRTVEAWG
jgi:hypothetical protein